MLRHNVTANALVYALAFCASSLTVRAADGLFGANAAPTRKQALKNVADNAEEAPSSTDKLFGIEATKEPVIKPASPAPEPSNKDELFGTDGANAPPISTAPGAAPIPEDKDELFGTDAPTQAAPAPGSSPATQSPHAEESLDTKDLTQAKEATPPDEPSSRLFTGITGFWQNELAYAYADKAHFSKWKNILRIVAKGELSESVKWQVSGHLIYDPIYELHDFYNKRVEDSQSYDGYFHETFLDISAGDWEVRIGRQNIVWGEAVGLFFADVVSALDLREFVLPDFDLIRIPQWAARAEYYAGDFHTEFVYIPVTTIDEIGEFGGEYFPFNVEAPPGFVQRFLKEKKPGSFGDDYAAGSRVSYLKDGWDVALFYHTTPDHSAAFSREISLAPLPTVTYRGIHPRIHQFGATLAKDVGPTVVKAEAVYTKDRLATVTDPLDVDGLIVTNELRYLLGVDWNIDEHTFNAQFFQTWFQHHRSTMLVDEVESGISLLFRTTAIHPDVEPEILWVRSLNRNEWLLEAKITWKFRPDWTWSVGTDVVEGPKASFLGEFDATDRVYSELRFSF